MRKKAKTKRNLFAELVEGIEQMTPHREGKITLRTHSVTLPAIAEAPGAEFFVAAREKFNVSRAVWADMLRVSPRTIEKWEQGGQGSPLAATFVELVVNFPDTIDRLRTLPKRIARNAEPDPALSPAITVRELFEAAYLPLCGPVPWEQPVPEANPGVYVVASAANPDDESGLLAPDGLDSKASRRWIPSQPILYVGQTSRPLATRIREFYAHIHGNRAPHRGGQDIKLLSCAKWVYWSPTQNAEEAEFRMIAEFEARFKRLPFGNLKHPPRPAGRSESQMSYA